jgi:D-aminoacyl-tRNA deacylase
MRAVVQRVKRAKVTIDGVVTGEINSGLLILIAMSASDTDAVIAWMANKLVNLRVFSDENQKMNLSVQDTGGSMLIVSNFTVYGDVRRGFRPSFTDSAPAAVAEVLYDKFVNYLKTNYKLNIQTGVFQAMMDVELVNDGPVTVIIEN